MHLHTVFLTENFRTLKAGHRFTFTNPISVITGDNGAGKSSLLGLIRMRFNHYWTPSSFSRNEGDGVAHLTPAASPDPDALLFIDLSRDHMQARGEFDERHYALQASLVRKSSGQVTLQQCASMLDSSPAPLVIIDEPEKGLSTGKQRAMLEIIRCAAEARPDRQFLITTHSPIIAAGLSDTVLALPGGAWMPTADYFAAMEAHGERLAATYRAARTPEKTPR